MVEELLASECVPADERDDLEQVWLFYKNTWPEWRDGALEQGEEEQEADAEESTKKEWKFHQLEVV